MEKYIIYKGSGGITHMLRGINYCIYRAKETKRTLIIDTLQHNAFLMNFNNIFSINDEYLKYYDHYDNIRKDVKYFDMEIDDIKKSPISCNKKKYYIRNYNISNVNWNTPNDIIIYSGTDGNIKFKSIKVVKPILDSLNNETKINDNYISGHFRNTDLKNNINNFIQRLQKKIDETNIKTFYLATDCFYAHEKIINEIPNINIIQNTLPPPNISNLHYGSTDKYKQVYECLRDIYFILKSDHFIPSINSGMSLLIIEMKKSKINFFDSKN